MWEPGSTTAMSTTTSRRGCWRSTAFAERVAVAAVLVATVPAPAAAYVRTRASAGAPEAWGGACVAFTVHLGDLPGASAEDVQQAVTAAAATWSAPAVDCTDLQVAVSFAEGPGPAAADDGLNAIGD